MTEKEKAEAYDRAIKRAKKWYNAPNIDKIPVYGNRLIERIKSDKMLMHYMSGEKQKIMTGEILSVPFKIKIDSYLKDEAIVDLKVMKDFSDVWSTAYNSRVNFVEAYNYDIELAIFQEIVFQNTGKKLPC